MSKKIKNSCLKILVTGCLTFVFILSGCVSVPKTDQYARSIRLSSLGFLTGAEKKASIVAPVSAFKVVRADGTTAFEGTATGPVISTDTNEEIYIADFSPLSEPGTYHVSVNGIGWSFPFEIADDLYNSPYKTAMLGMYLWRCGAGVKAVYNGDTFAHEPCHLDDGYLDFVTGKHDKMAGTGGWHDAGDYNKYTVNAGVSVGIMLKAWEQFRDKIEKFDLEVPEKSNAVPDYLDEIRFELDWLLTMQYPDGSGKISHKLSAKDFNAFLLPEYESSPRYFSSWGSAATADFVAMMAQAARIYTEFDAAFAEKCLLAAKASYAFLAKNPADTPADIKAFKTGAYQTTDPDDRLWAAAELWETTGDPAILADFEKRASVVSPKIESDWDWGNVGNLGMITYLLSKRTGRDESLVTMIRKDLLSSANSIVGTKNSNAYARPLGSTYYWGCNGSVARQTFILQAANMIQPKSDYVSASLDVLNHLFGRNYYGRSFVTGLGFNPPLYPHDRRSGGDAVDNPWPGYLVGGARHGAMEWYDIEPSYETNEIAINWNAALIYAMAGFLHP